MYGVLQVVMRDTTLLEGINKEDCISLEGDCEHEMRKHIIQRFRPEQLN